MKVDCVFCQLTNKEIESHIVFEDENVCCFLDYHPINIGHILIVPKKHYLDLIEIDEETCNSVMRASKFLSMAVTEVFKPDGISIMQNGGVFNDVGHYHMHVFPRYKDDGFGWTYPNLSNKENPSLNEVRERIIKAMSF